MTLDATVANVALPRIQSSVAASPEQIVWPSPLLIAGADLHAAQRLGSLPATGARK
ncbi:MAG: hypothetical protein R3E09_11345 [Novosphingobium sp.]